MSVTMPLETIVSGSSMVYSTESTQPLPSVTNISYTPPAKVAWSSELGSSPEPGVTTDQKGVRIGVPPERVTSMTPFPLPLQSTFSNKSRVIEIGSGEEI